MWNRHYQFGDVILRIESQLEIPESERFAVFRVESEFCDFKITVKAGAIPSVPEVCEERTQSRCTWIQDHRKYSVRYMTTKEGMVPVSCTIGNQERAEQIYDKTAMKYLDTRLIFEGFDFFGLLNRKGAVTLHASYIKYKESAVIFSGASGIGKSTQASLWKEYRGAEVINGDRTLIQKKNGIFYAHGICYAGTSKICHNVSLPLKAIIVLRKASVNHVSRMGGRDSLRAILAQCSFHKTNGEEMKTLTSVLAELLTEVPVYLLECTPDERAVETLEEVLWTTKK